MSSIQCYAKCTIDKTEIVNPNGGLDVEKMVRIAKIKGTPEAIIRSMCAKCNSLYKKNMNCEESYLAYKCSLTPF